MRALLAPLGVLAAAGAAAAALQAPARVTLDGVGGVSPGMRAGVVSRYWGVRLRLDYLYPDNPCASASFEKSGVRGHAIFVGGRFGAVFLQRGAVTGRGIRIGSSLADVRRAYGSLLTSRINRYTTGRDYFVRRARAPHWELRIDVSPQKEVTQIAFGDRNIRRDEGCA